MNMMGDSSGEPGIKAYERFDISRDMLVASQNRF